MLEQRWKKVLVLGLSSLFLFNSYGELSEKLQMNSEKGRDTMVIVQERGTWMDPKQKKKLTKEEVFRKLDRAKVILIGETHTDYEIHRWQLAVLSIVYGRNHDVAVGFEMFPSRLDPVLQEWTGGELTKDEFLEKAEWKKVWGYDPELYWPLFDFCRQNQIPMFGMNLDREVIKKIGKEGWEGLTLEESRGMTPAKPASSEYRKYLDAILNQPNNPMAGKLDMDYFVRAQQAWDRSFAWNITKYLTENPNSKIIGIVGKGHMEYGYGIPYQLKDLKVEDVLVLLPSFDDAVQWEKIEGSGDAIFRLDRLEK